MARRNKICAVLHRPLVKRAKLYETVAEHIGVRGPPRPILANHVVHHFSFILFFKVKLHKGNPELGTDAHRVQPVVCRLAQSEQGPTFFHTQGQTLFGRGAPHLDENSSYFVISFFQQSRGYRTINPSRQSHKNLFS